MTTHLPPTPLSATGAPHPATPELPELPDHSPVMGKRCVIDGVEMVEVTFVAHEPRGREVLVHVNSLTDAIRTRLDPAVMTPFGDNQDQAFFTRIGRAVVKIKYLSGLHIGLDTGRN